MQERITYIGNEKKITMEPSYSLEMLGDQEYLTKYQLANKLLELSDTPIEYRRQVLRCADRQYGSRSGA